MPCLSHWTAASVGSMTRHRSSASNAPARCSRSERSTVGHCSCSRSAHRFVHSSAFMVRSGGSGCQPSILARIAGFMYSIDMRPPSLTYRCRLCGAASYRKTVHRGPEGAMVYSGLYRCSGCPVTFTDPSSWREAPVRDAAADSDGGAARGHDTSAVASRAGIPSPSTWGVAAPPSSHEPNRFGDTEEGHQGDSGSCHAGEQMQGSP